MGIKTILLIFITSFILAHSLFKAIDVYLYSISEENIDEEIPICYAIIINHLTGFFISIYAMAYIIKNYF